MPMCIIIMQNFSRRSILEKKHVNIRRCTVVAVVPYIAFEKITPHACSDIMFNYKWISIIRQEFIFTIFS